MTEPEMRLWYFLRNELLGAKFRRQFSIRNFVLDFYCPRLKLGIEIDGDSHFTKVGSYKDRLRDAYLRDKGIRLLRFLNNDVMRNIEGVIEKINEQIARPPLYLPLSKGEKGRGWR